jgi:hypothetical protein
MKANELMVGDWVYNHRKWEYPIVEIHKDSAVVVARHYGEEEFELSDLYPIPLTPEILEKNGFITEEREGDPTFPYLAFIIENDEYRIEITWYDSHDVYEPNTGEYLHGAPEVWNMEILGKCGNYDFGKNKLYLHEFQHALKLCGIEKNIII